MVQSSKDKLQEGPQNAKYTSPEIQSSLLGELGGIALGYNFIREAHVFTLLVDEKTDSSKVEQLAIVCRYTDINTATIHEQFLTYVPAPSLTAESLSQSTLDTLRKH